MTPSRSSTNSPGTVPGQSRWVPPTRSPRRGKVTSDGGDVVCTDASLRRNGGVLVMMEWSMTDSRDWSDERVVSGGVDDVATVMALIDRAVDRLTGMGRSAQWGEERWSVHPARVDRIKGLVTGGRLHLLTRGGEVAGALVASPEAPRYVPAVQGPENYIHLLVSSTSAAGHGAGRRLLEESWQLTRRRGIHTERVDCWAGGDRWLVRYYLSAGFGLAGTYDYNGWPGQVFKRAPSTAT